MARRLAFFDDEMTHLEEERLVTRANRAVSRVCPGIGYSLVEARQMDVGKKLEIVRAAVRYDFPSGDIADMLAEIESGYGSGPPT